MMPNRTTGDVETKLVLEVTEKIKDRAINEKPPPGLVKIILLKSYTMSLLDSRILNLNSSS